MLNLEFVILTITLIYYICIEIFWKIDGLLRPKGQSMSWRIGPRGFLPKGRLSWQGDYFQFWAREWVDPKSLCGSSWGFLINKKGHNAAIKARYNLLTSWYIAFEAKAFSLAKRPDSHFTFHCAASIIYDQRLLRRNWKRKKLKVRHVL